MMLVVLDAFDSITQCRYIVNIPEYIPRPGNNWTFFLAAYKLKDIERISYHIKTIQHTAREHPLPPE